MYLIKKEIKAFTLIELLVVMAIIAILSAIMFGPIQTARLRAKDTRAVADMKLIKSYLELYADDHNGLYPYKIQDLEIYGKLPSRTLIIVQDDGTYLSSNPDKYNYSAFYSNTGGECVTISSGLCRTGYHLWTHMNDMNESLNNDADCNSGDPSTCWDMTNNGWFDLSININAKSGNDSTGDGDNSGNKPSISVCKDKTKCILDYSNTR